MGDFRENIIPHSHAISREDRQLLNNHQAKVLWFTGLSGSGKSTLAGKLEAYLHKKGFRTYLMDGDNVRKGLNADLDFSEYGRKENIRRIAEVSKLFVDAGIIVSTAFISPFIEDRNAAKKLIGEENFLEIYIECPLEICEQRDIKGLYKKARAGKIKDFTGIDSPFEPPVNPDIKVNTGTESVEECLKQMIEEIEPILK